MVLLKAGYSGPEELSQGRLRTDHSDELFPGPCTPALRAYTETVREQDLLLSWDNLTVG